MKIPADLISIDFFYIVSAGVGGGLVLAVQAFSRAVATDVAKRITSSLWGMKIIDYITPRILRHEIWSGVWQVTWEVESTNFGSINTHEAQLYRCFNSVALEGLKNTTSGGKISYGFIGKLSRDKTIVTGTWFDRRGGDGGYHGVYQLRIAGTGDRANGLWSGFSETSADIKVGRLSWSKIKDHD